MDDRTAPTAAFAEGSSRFELAPPRRFILPAVLLLLSERPTYGYALLPQLKESRFGHVDRPAVYRALARLEADGLVKASSANGTAGQSRRTYEVTDLGRRVLREWMGVVKEEHDHLGQVLRRYQATGRADAALAEVDGGWGASLGRGWSPVSSTSEGFRHLVSYEAEPAPKPSDDGDRLTMGGLLVAGPTASRRLFRLVPERSVVLIEVRSTVGPLSFGSIGVTGVIEATVADQELQTDDPPSARVEIDVSKLTSGNSVYDAELLRRIDARRYPKALVELGDCGARGPDNHYRLTGDLTFHGVSRPARGPYGSRRCRMTGWSSPASRYSIFATSPFPRQRC